MKLKIISSSAELFTAADIIGVDVPTVDGEIGILENHINLVSRLDIGSVKIRHLGGKYQEIVVNGGIVQVVNNEILILADEATLPEELVSEEIETAIRKAEEKMASEKLEPSELIQLEKQLRYERFKKDRLSTS